MKTKDKTAAIVTIFDAPKMGKRGRNTIANWLIRQAGFLRKHGNELSSHRFCARYIYVPCLLLCLSLNAQTNTPPLPPPMATNAPAPPSLPEIPTRILEFLSATSTNWLVSSYGIYSSDIDGFGFGVAAGYSITPNIVTIMRVDYLDGEIWMPSGSVQLQAPIRLMDRFTVTPFVFAGIATPLSGRGDDNRTAAGIAGTGLAARLNQHLGVVYDLEYWSNFSGPQHRFGVYWKF